MTNYNPNCGYYEDYGSGYYTATSAVSGGHNVNNVYQQQDYYMTQDYEYKHGYE